MDSNKKRIAVIGLGIMGHGIADNFLKNGYEVIVWNRTAQKCEPLVSKGAKVAASIKEAVNNSDIIIEVTANDESSKSIWFGGDGIIENANADQYLMTFATLSIDYTSQLSKTCEERSLTFLDMPMTGGRVGAETGNLILLAGGNADKLDTLRKDLSAISTDIKYFGPTTSGMKFKLILNYMQAVHVSVFGDALRIAKTVGLDVESVGEVLAERPGGMHSNIAWNAYKSPPEEISFSVDWITKDLRYASQLDKTIEHPYLEAAVEVYEGAVTNGLGKYDWTKVNEN